MKIQVSDPEFWFAFFYCLSFAVTFVLIIIFSYRLKIPLWSVLLVLTTISLCTIIGSRISTVPFSDWDQLIKTGRLDEYHGRFAVGGLLFGLGGLLFSQRVLGIKNSIFNLYAWVAPLGFGIQKVGCFLNGCCYGKPSDMPWSIQYPVGTSAHFHQSIEGLIGDAGYSLSIFPVQLFEVICLFAIGYIAWRSQQFMKRVYSSLIFSISLFFIFRFSFSFLRDHESVSFNYDPFMGFTVLQMFYLLSGIICLIVLLRYEWMISEKSRNPVLESQPSFTKSILYVTAVSVVIYSFRGLFTPFELLSLEIRFVPAVLLTAYYVYKSLRVARFQLAGTSSFAIPLLMILPLIQDSVKTDTIKTLFQDVKSYKRIDAGSSFGEYYNTARYNPQAGDCGTTYSSADYKQVYRLAGAGYSVIKQKEKSLTTIGVNLFGGTNKEYNFQSQIEKTDLLAGVNPYIKHDVRWIGVGAGLHIGNIRWVRETASDEITNTEGTRFSPVMPEVYFRVGRRDILDLKYTYGFNFPTTLPVLMHEISLGSGFSFENDYNFRVGRSVSENNLFTFVSAEALLNEQFGLALRYNFAGEDFYSNNNSEVISRKGRFLFGMNYRFGFEK